MIDFSLSKKDAAIHGFHKGMSCPIMIFGKFNAPPLRKIDVIVLPSNNVEAALSGDWITIGEDFNNALVKYGKEADTK